MENFTSTYRDYRRGLKYELIVETEDVTVSYHGNQQKIVHNKNILITKIDIEGLHPTETLFLGMQHIDQLETIHQMLTDMSEGYSDMTFDDLVSYLNL